MKITFYYNKNSNAVEAIADHRSYWLSKAGVLGCAITIKHLQSFIDHCNLRPLTRIEEAIYINDINKLKKAIEPS